MIDRCRANRRSSFLYASISHVSEPKQSKRGEWPLYAVNRNTGKDAESAANRIATQRVFAGSRITLPVSEAK